jgi:phosphoglucomutase
LVEYHCLCQQGKVGQQCSRYLATSLQGIWSQLLFTVRGLSTAFIEVVLLNNLVTKPTLLASILLSRYDYEEVEAKGANQMVQHLQDQIQTGELKGKTFGDFKIAFVDDFEYKDPIDKSVSSKQGIRIVFEDGSRVVIRLSGTGSQGATVRLYVEKYSSNAAEYDADTQKALKPLIDQALVISQLKELTGREKPTVIT